MTDETTSDRAQGLTVRRVVYAVLGVQVLLAVLLMGGDLWRAIPSIGMPSSQPRFDQPVNPGDQTRRYRPADMPLPPTRDGTPNRPFTSTNDMPDRLTFRLNDGVLTLTGGISPGDADRFDMHLLSEDAEVVTVRLNSPGGSVSDALVIGQRVRDEGFQTALLAGDICLSACPYILAGGTARAVAEDAQVGVHQHFFDVNTVLPAFLAVEDIQRGQGAVMAYLDAMGVDPMVMQHALVTPPDEIYVLLREELETYRFVTDADDTTAEGG